MRAVLILVVCGLARAEPPRHIRPFLSRQQELPSHGPPPNNQYVPSSYGPPPSGPPEYLPPNEYLPPPTPAEEYGPPRQQIITKNVYVHLPPRVLEEEQPPYPPHVTPRTPQKHYKIIFIKTPNQPTPQVPEIPADPQDEHKTLVYVLVKKPEEPTAVEPPPPTTTEATKPEVYFIKYKENRPADTYGPPR